MPQKSFSKTTFKNAPNKLQAKFKTKQSSRIYLIIGGTFVVLTIVLVTIMALLYLPLSPADTQKQHVQITKNSTAEDIGTLLEQKKLVRSGWLFTSYVTITGQRNKLQSGTYLMSADQNIPNLADQLALGQFAQVQLVVPEGYTVRDIAARYAKLGLGSAEDFVRVAQAQLGTPFVQSTGATATVEGLLQPATYKVGVDDTTEKVVNTMLSSFQKQNWSLLVGTPAPGGLTPYQVLTLASIVEREGTTEADRKMVAGVFLNRLSRGMKLESDVTVNYATGRTNTTPQDVLINSPYNTYKIVGLPPSPINNPGAESIEAVLHPTTNDYIFFLADKQGNLHFAKTLSEHQQNIRKYLEN